MAEDRNMYTIKEDGGIGTVKVADEVVAIIAGLAATEVDGVYSMAGGITNELVSMLGRKNLSAGVDIECNEGAVWEAALWPAQCILPAKNMILIMWRPRIPR